MWRSGKRQYRMKTGGVYLQKCFYAVLPDMILCNGLDVTFRIFNFKSTSTYEFMKKCEGGKRNAKKR